MNGDESAAAAGHRRVLVHVIAASLDAQLVAEADPLHLHDRPRFGVAVAGALRALISTVTQQRADEPALVAGPEHFEQAGGARDVAAEVPPDVLEEEDDYEGVEARGEVQRHEHPLQRLCDVIILISS